MNHLCHTLGIQYPIIQAPMALSDSPELCVSVSNEGGLGSLGAALFMPDQIREKIRMIRQRTNKAFVINLFAPLQPRSCTRKEIRKSLQALNYFRQKLHIQELDEIEIKPAAAFEEQLSVILEEKIPVFSFTFGILPNQMIERIKAEGIRIIGTATTVREAIALEKSGVDAIVAQGYEAGGHRGTDLKMTAMQDALIGTMALVPQVVDAVKIPVIASGGIMDARGILAAFALGASAVQMGTAFLSCDESSIHPAHRERLLSSTDESTRLTEVFTGRMARSIKNSFLLEMEQKNFPLLDYPLQSAMVKDIREASQKQNNAEYMSLWAGQASALCQQKKAADLFRELVAGSFFDGVRS